MRVPTALLGCAVLLALGCSAAAGAEERQPPPFVAVTGSGQVQIPPDHAVVHLGVEATAPTAQEAQREVNTRIQAILTRVRALGIPQELIQTARIQLFPIYTTPRRPEEGAPRLVGYRASNIVRIEVRNLDQTGPVIDAGTAGGANRVEGLFFGVRDDTEPRMRALRSAAEKARQKAQTLAIALGVRLGSPLEVSEAAAVVVPRFAMERAAAGAIAETPVEPGLITIEANVSVRYRLLADR